jgi:hypothetical protein
LKQMAVREEIQYIELSSINRISLCQMKGHIFIESKRKDTFGVRII